MFARLLLFAMSAAWVVAFSPSKAFADEAISWHRSIRPALENAARLNRPVLLYASSSSCRYCREMERRTLADPIVSGVLRDHFVPLAVDGDRETETLDALKIEGVPTLVVLSPSGEVIARISGFIPPQELANRLRTIGADRQAASSKSR